MWKRRLHRRACASLLVCAGFALAAPGAALAAQRSATPGSLGSVFASARGGDTILLGSGDYGRFTGGRKSNGVVIRARPGATARMDVDLDSATNITVENMSLNEVEISGSGTRNIIVRNSTITGQTVFRTGELRNANILFDHNRHPDWDVCGNCAEGRVWLPENTNEPSGITISNSEFVGGLSDGIQNGSNGTRIISNEFHDIEQGSADGVHSDAIQLYGAKNTLIKGNYFHDLPNGSGVIMSPDGADHEIIEDNVFGDGIRRPFAIDLFSDDGSIVRHNTFADGACEFNLRCGILRIGSKDADDAGHDTIVKDNVLGEISRSGDASIAENSYNLIRDGSSSNHNIVGTPSYVGGSSPSSYSGYLLKAGSPGKGNASDGLDRGIRPNGGPPTSGPPSSSPSGSIRVLSTLRSIRRSGKLRLRVRTTQTGNLRVSGFVRPGAALKGMSAGHSRKLIRLRKVSLGTRTAGTRTVTIKLGPRTRRTLGRSRNARLTAVVKVGSSVMQRKLKIKRK